MKKIRDKVHGVWLSLGYERVDGIGLNLLFLTSLVVSI